MDDYRRDSQCVTRLDNEVIFPFIYSLYITLVRCMLLQHWFNSRMYGVREVLIIRLPPMIYRPTNDHRPIWYWMCIYMKFFSSQCWLALYLYSWMDRHQKSYPHIYDHGNNMIHVIAIIHKNILESGFPFW